MKSDNEPPFLTRLLWVMVFLAALATLQGLFDLAEHKMETHNESK